jgi:uncharacterized protein YeeX (DUF496 family)
MATGDYTCAACGSKMTLTYGEAIGNPDISDVIFDKKDTARLVRAQKQALINEIGNAEMKVRELRLRFALLNSIEQYVKDNLPTSAL